MWFPIEKMDDILDFSSLYIINVLTMHYRACILERMKPIIVLN